LRAELNDKVEVEELPQGVYVNEEVSDAGGKGKDGGRTERHANCDASPRSEVGELFESGVALSSEVFGVEVAGNKQAVSVRSVEEEKEAGTNRMTVKTKGGKM
jgi:hypothetical protein